jgi:hypothetical protein
VLEREHQIGWRNFTVLHQSMIGSINETFPFGVRDSGKEFKKLPLIFITFYTNFYTLARNSLAIFKSQFLGARA